MLQSAPYHHSVWCRGNAGCFATLPFGMVPWPRASAVVSVISLRVRLTATPFLCRDGISHSPLEYVSPDDVAAATATLYQYLRRELLAAPPTPAASTS